MSHSPEKLAVKSAWKMLVAAIGGVAATAACTRASVSLASDYGNRNTERFAPADIILEAEAIAGEPFVTAALARAAGYELTKMDTPREAAELAKLLAETSLDAGQLFATGAKALASGTLSPAALADLRREWGDMHRVSTHALAWLRAQAAGGDDLL